MRLLCSHNVHSVCHSDYHAAFRAVSAVQSEVCSDHMRLRCGHSVHSVCHSDYSIPCSLQSRVCCEICSDHITVLHGLTFVSDVVRCMWCVPFRSHPTSKPAKKATAIETWLQSYKVSCEIMPDSLSFVSPLRLKVRLFGSLCAICL
jgi:hypothetical protein